MDELPADVDGISASQTEQAVVLIDAPPRAKLYRRFHHSIMIPFFHLDRRSLENIAINPTENDICLIAADICVSCFHFIEHARHEDRELADRLESFTDLKWLTDIANTRKHLIRHKAAKQVNLIGRLAFEIAADLYGFIQTEVIAVNSADKEHDVLRLILNFINHVRVNAEFGESIELNRPKPKVYLSSCVSRLTYRTLAMEQSVYSFWRSNPDGTYRKAEGGLTVSLEVIPDIGENETIGRIKLTHDIPEILKWFDT